ncbi:phosphonate ABC transporter, permease protein PhnE [Crocosphaera chwakensis]|uniref:ABC phosphonate permease n=1 Tax=Crocosphaera chwakensis CCY0110 TaxID=391612 RepID=A3IUM5_9CHRO|nr:phosphonate ABC transporter, permease protein PhnE [Crocosphaera chwakensis]EAZ89817.1 ABC phosphonate permease [Crocosphaera chwakensis CCY0110]
MKKSLWHRHWPTQNGLPSLGIVLFVLIIIIILLVTAPLVEFNPLTIVKSTDNFFAFVSNLLTVPEWRYVPTLTHKLLETIAMGFLSTVFSCCFSLPLGILAARNSSPLPIIFHLVRNLLSLMRALPEIVWALLFVSALGLGPFPGILALTFVTTGFMGKFFAESIEVVDVGMIEGVQATGANWLQKVHFSMLPQAMPDFIGTTLYILDNNIRSATVLGFVGAGGIGYELISSIRLFNYGRLILIVLAIYLTVTILDHLSTQLRSYII